jgi:response regulator RpfG family c-di-GMP phosphodiesterase
LVIAAVCKTAEPHPAHAQHAWQGPGLKILLVEDNLTNINYTPSVLEMLGCSVVVAENGKAGFEYSTCP